MIERLRKIIFAVNPAIVEERKWAKPSNSSGVPTWSNDGIVTTGETCKDKVKLTFANGANLDDPTGLFNNNLDGNFRRAIDVREGAEVDEAALTALVPAAVAFNRSKEKR